MNAFAELLESELNEVFVKQNKDALKRVSYIVGEKINKVEEMEKRQTDQKTELMMIAENMKKGFELMEERFKVMDERFKVMDERFKTMDERFKAMDKRFSQLMWFIGILSGVIVAAVKLIK